MENDTTEKFTRKEINRFRKAIREERIKLFRSKENEFHLIPKEIKSRKILAAKDINAMRQKENPDWMKED